jgi:hypothetical protein
MLNAPAQESIAFSVAVPVGKADERLNVALRSLVIQNAKLNIALLDASGSDRVRRIADEFRNDLTVRIHKPDTGQAAAIREGWSQVPGEILCWLNADDALLPGTLAQVAELFEARPEIDAVYGHSTVHDSAGRMIGYHMAVDNVSDALLQTNLISQPSCFVRRKAVKDVGGINPDLQYVMDWDLWVRLYKAGKNFHFVDKPFSGVVWETGTKTASVSPKRLCEIFRLVFHHAGLTRALGTIFGVVRHHLGTYTILARLHKKLRPRHAASTRKTIAGLDRDGRVIDEARIPLANLSAAPLSIIAVQLEWADEGLESLMVDDFVAPNPKDDEIKVLLPTPVPPGKASWLTIRAVPGRDLRFISAAWCETDIPVSHSP